MSAEGRGGGSFFGRHKGRPLRAGQREAMAALLPALRIDVSSPPPDVTTLFGARVDEVRLEIGFGGGEHLLHEARNNPDVGFIGVEPFESGVAKVVSALAREPAKNVRLFDQDATLLLDWMPEESLARVDLLFPDPWPKKRHWKRRFVKPENLARIARVLKPGGLFRFASDVEDYVEWTLDAVAKHGGFERVDHDGAPWPGWPGTRYEAKAAKAGRRRAFLQFRKNM
jgi:tRNA (guanine-N7-)-methyltransferase